MSKTVLHTGSSPLQPHDSELIDALLREAAFPHPVDRIELVETHISWVVLTGDFAYKIKKPVDLGFLDFRQLERRHFFCEEEIRLNRFWAPDIYLDVVPIVLRDGLPAVSASGEAVEYAVRMRQFDQALRLDSQLESGKLTEEDMLELATEIAGRHLEAPPVKPHSSLLSVTKRLMWDNIDDLEGQVADKLLLALRQWTKDTLRDMDAVMKARCETGYFRECHGDLHLANIVRLPDGIAAFDCIEFSVELRNIDVVADYSFLVMDLIARGKREFAYRFLNRYLEITGDYDGMRLFRLYFVYRCLVRAKVAAIRRRERGPGESLAEDRHTIDHYCDLGRAYTVARRPTLLLMSGLSGSGKTWISTRLLGVLPALRLRSDLERKRCFGLAETADSHSGIASGIYSGDADDAVYRRMFDSAESLLAAGFDVILDAAFLDAANREQGRQLAARCGAGFVIVEAVVPVRILRERLRQRSAGGTDASEADLAVLKYQIGHAAPLSSGERSFTVSVNTDSAVDIESIARRVRNLSA